jgi:FKBP-type peptidyl-prolyl cis-trans isomerase 2
MRKLLIPALLAAVLAAGCAKSPQEGPNDAEIRFFESWVISQRAKHPEYLWNETTLGSYILEEEVGTGALVGSAEASPYLNISFVITDLQGNILKSSEEADARRLGTFSSNSYYGPRTVYRGDTGCTAGENEIFTGMKVGGTRKAVIPGWLMTSSIFENPADYLTASSGGESAIYTITVKDVFSDVVKWQVDSLERTIKRLYPSASLDTSGMYGFYYYQLTPPADSDETMNAGDKFDINYTGFLLNGHIFDSTDEIICKDNDLPEKSEYGPTYISWNEDYQQITLGEDAATPVSGFAYALSKMKPGEKGVAFFYSNLGYQYKGSEPTIPSYCPLAFELEMVGKKSD